MTATSTSMARWVTDQFPIAATGARCRYCGSAQTHDCPPVDCLACGSRQCHSNGLGNGRCAVCYYGYLPGWYRDPDAATCGYRGCTEPALAAAPRIRRVCRRHLDRPTLRWTGVVLTLAEYITGRVARRDRGDSWQGWHWVDLGEGAAGATPRSGAGLTPPG